jgi:hypothetical protein
MRFCCVQKMQVPNKTNTLVVSRTLGASNRPVESIGCGEICTPDDDGLDAAEDGLTAKAD